MLAELELSNKRTKKNLKRRASAKGRATARASYELGRMRHQERLTEYELTKRAAAYEAAKEKSRAPIARAAYGGNWRDKVKAGLRAMLPRRTGGGE